MLGGEKAQTSLAIRALSWLDESDVRVKDLDRAVRARVCAVIERFVAAAAYIENDPDIGGSRSFGRCQSAAAGEEERKMYSEERAGDDQKFAHSIGKNRTRQYVMQGDGRPFQPCRDHLDFNHARPDSYTLPGCRERRRRIAYRVAGFG